MKNTPQTNPLENHTTEYSGDAFVNHLIAGYSTVVEYTPDTVKDYFKAAVEGIDQLTSNATAEKLNQFFADAAGYFDPIVDIFSDGARQKSKTGFAPRVPPSQDVFDYEDIYNQHVFKFDDVPQPIVDSPLITSQINGNNGSATNTDDHSAPNTKHKKQQKQKLPAPTVATAKAVLAAVEAAKQSKAKKPKRKPKQKYKHAGDKIEAEAIRENISDAVQLVIARKILFAAIRNPFNVQLPFLGSATGKIIPVSGRLIGRDTTNMYTFSDTVLYVLHPSFKATLSIYKSLTNSSFGIHANVDCGNLASIASVITTARVGIAGLSVTVRNPPAATAVTPTLYVGRLPISCIITAQTPNWIMNNFGTKYLPGKTASVVWTPADIDSAKHFSTLPVDTGPSTADSYPIIMVQNYNLATDAVNYQFTVQGEGMQTTDQDKIAVGKPINGSYTTEHLYEGLPTGLIASHLPPSLGGEGLGSHITSAVSKQELKGPYSDIKHKGEWSWDKTKPRLTAGRRFPIHLNSGVDVYYDEDQIRLALLNPEFIKQLPLANAEWFIQNYGPPILPPSQSVPVFHTVEHAEEIRECKECGDTTIQEGTCDSCVREAAHTTLVENNGVQSVDSTPEAIRRKLDELKIRLTGKFPLPQATHT